MWWYFLFAGFPMASFESARAYTKLSYPERDFRVEENVSSEVIGWSKTHVQGQHTLLHDETFVACALVILKGMGAWSGKLLAVEIYNVTLVSYCLMQAALHHPEYLLLCQEVSYIVSSLSTAPVVVADTGPSAACCLSC